MEDVSSSSLDRVANPFRYCQMGNGMLINQASDTTSNKYISSLPIYCHEDALIVGLRS